MWSYLLALSLAGAVLDERNVPIEGAAVGLAAGNAFGGRRLRHGWTVPDRDPRIRERYPSAGR